ncbi:DsbA family protein [Gammaproteobacteria bacterium]|nr:DsbA family protein [Gammaproteobacteria bacterium]
MKSRKFPGLFQRRASATLLLVAVSFSMLTHWGPTYAAEGEQTAATLDEEQLVERVTQAIMEELRNGELLQQQIEIGIQNFILKQQQSRENAEKSKRGRADKLAENVRPVSAERDHIRGNAEAEISLIEYSDFECPFCKRFHPTAKQLVKAYDGKVNWVYRHFPLSFHNPGAQKQAEASECANELGGNDIFWTYNDSIYERTTSNGKGFPVDNLIPLAVELGMDEQQFKECLDSGRHADRVKEDFVEGSSIGVTGTPGNVLRSNRTGKALMRPGAQPFARLKADIDGLLAAAPGAQE